LCFSDAASSQFYALSLHDALPILRDMGVDGIWVPVPTKGNNSRGGNGYDLFDPYDLGHKHQKGSTGTRWGNQDQFLRLIATAHKSEEHTSELQSRENLVCRLLLEK